MRMTEEYCSNRLTVVNEKLEARNLELGIGASSSTADKHSVLVLNRYEKGFADWLITVFGLCQMMPPFVFSILLMK